MSEPANLYLEDSTLQRPRVEGGRFYAVEGESGVLTVSAFAARGWPRVIEVQGTVKCLICDGISESMAVCAECREAVRLLRATDNIQIMKRLLELEHLDVLLHVMEGLTKDAVTAYLVGRLQDTDD